MNGWITKQSVLHIHTQKHDLSGTKERGSLPAVALNVPYQGILHVSHSIKGNVTPKTHAEEKGLSPAFSDEWETGGSNSESERLTGIELKNYYGRHITYIMRIKSLPCGGSW